LIIEVTSKEKKNHEAMDRKQTNKKERKKKNRRLRLDMPRSPSSESVEEYCR
jgi:hypothetical protein